MQSLLLERRTFYAQNTDRITSEQLEHDLTLQHFSEEATNPLTLTAIVAGGFTYKASKLGLGKLASPLLTQSGSLGRFLTHTSIKTAALSAEVAAFRSISQGPAHTFEAKGFATDFLNFFTLKGAGKLAHGKNIVFTHFLQSAAMVTGHNLAYGLGIGLAPQGNLIEQFAHAEATNLQLGLGMSLVGRFAPGIARMERVMDVQNQALAHPSSPFAPLPSPFAPLPQMKSVESNEAVGVESRQEISSGRDFNMWGERLFNASKVSWSRPSSWRSPFRIVQDLVLNEMLKDEGTKKRMIAFLDVATGAPDRSLAKLFRIYFPKGGGQSRGVLRFMLNAGTSRFTPDFCIVWGVRLGLRSMAQRFLAGETPESALAKVLARRKLGIESTLDVVQENVVSESEAEHYTNTVLKLIEALQNTRHLPDYTRGKVPVRHISVKLSALTHRFEALPHDWVIGEVGKRLLKIFLAAKAAKEAGAPILVNVDLEDYAVRDLSYEILWNTLSRRELAGWDEAGVVVQTYYKESAHTLARLLDRAENEGKKIQIRLVKGAYHSFEQIRAARNGWEIPVYLDQAETDANFRKLAEMALQKNQFVRIAIGSHNLEDIAYVQALRSTQGLGIEAVEHQFLRGVGDHLAKATSAFDIPTRQYDPFGSEANGLGYMVRRLDEVKANSAIGQTHHSGSWGNYREHKANLSSPRQAPVNEVADFVNEAEIDFSRAEVREAMTRALREFQEAGPKKVTPLIGFETYETGHRLSEAIVNPGNWQQEVSHVWNANGRDVQRAIEIAQTGFQDWSTEKQYYRSTVLNRAADILQARKYEVAAYLAYEAGKIWPLALAEVNEGIDFLRAYAHDAKAVSQQRKALGVGIAIAPFNFPFAIALGELAGGLALGNAMILKPSEQTPAVGKLLVEVLREAGVPHEAIQLLPGTGAEIGHALVASPDIDFVVFTGSLATATQIMETARLHPSKRHGYKVVVTETGGKNAMIVDESADLDVAVKAILEGAFLASGQRCSATSRVFVLDSVAQALMKRLGEGANSMLLGDAGRPETQIGPQIDQRAFEKVMRYLKLGAEWGLGHAPSQMPPAVSGHYIRPWIFEGTDPRAPFAQEEIFGPALAVMRVRNFDEAIRLTNQSPYGLTAGLISRNPENISKFFRHVQAGNLYVNRSQVGAMVWRQPFGGAKDSGTGPKAGGRQYVARFGRPRQIPHVHIEIPAIQQDITEASFTPKISPEILQAWQTSRPNIRIQFVREIMAALVVPDHYIESALNREQREILVRRLQKYLFEAEMLLKPQVTLPSAGEINEEAHDWPLGRGLILAQHEKTENFIAASVGALLMGNGIVLPEGPKANIVEHLLRDVALKMKLTLPVERSSLEELQLLNHASIDFVVTHGSLATEAFGHFRAKLPGKVGFRRAIGAHMDHPDDSYYLTRFASARTRTEETLRHGAELNLR